MDADSSVRERRSFVRVKDSLPTQVQFINGERKESPATIENIGEGGLCVAASLSKAKVKKEVYLRIELPGCPSHLDIAAIVVWTKESQKNILLIGLKFSGISNTTQNHINRYIQSRIASKPFKKLKKFVFKRASLNRLTERERRNLIILNALQKKGTLSKAQVSQIADLNIGTITNYIDDYIRRGLVLEMGLDVSTGGRRPTLLELNPGYGFSIGVDISNNKKGLAVLVCDIRGKIINKYLSTSKSEKEFKVNNIVNCVSRIMDSSNLSQEDLLGVGVAGAGNAENNFSDLTQALEGEFNASILVENASCATLFAEKTMNPSLSEVANILYFSLFSSECGLVINADLYRTGSKFTIDMNNDKSQLGNNCWDKGEGCLLRSLPEHDKEDIEALCRDVGARLAVLTNILKPDVVILGDIEGKEMIRDYLSDIKDKIRHFSISDHNKLPKILLGHFGQEAAGLGAALLVAREVFIQA